MATTMVRLHGMVMSTTGLFGRAAAGFVALVMVAATFAPSSGSGDPSRSLPGDPGWRPNTFALMMPEGQTSNTVNITDEAGRELASLTRFHDGNTAVIARRPDRTGVSAFFKTTGRTVLELDGKMGRTRIEMEPGGAPVITSGAVPIRPETPDSEEMP